VEVLQTILSELVEPAEGPREHASKLFNEVAQFPAFKNIKNGDLFSLSLANKTSARTHGFHRFPAKYIPRVPAWALDQFAASDSVVLDPFCGSGTTLVEALSHTRQVIGLDCDPLACLISRAKTTAVSPSRVQELAANLRRNWSKTVTEMKPPMDGVVNFGHWFSSTSWGCLQELFTAITTMDCTDEEQTFFLCLFSSILRWVSNADDQTQKTYVSGTLKKSPPEVAPTFWKALEKATNGLDELSKVRLDGATSTVLRGSATDIPLPDGSVDLIVTSPPYLDSVDYMYNFMLEYFWLGPLLGVPDRKVFNSMRRNVTGAKNPLQLETLPLAPCLSDLICESEISSGRVSAMRAYCDNMSRHFESASRVLKRDGLYVLVIGNSQSTQGALPIHDSLIRLAAEAGFTFQKAFAYRIRRHYMKFPRAGRGGIITMDWVITLKNTQRKVQYPKRLPMPAFTLGHGEVAN
jgi:DNA modification methylase